MTRAAAESAPATQRSWRFLCLARGAVLQNFLWIDLGELSESCTPVRNCSSSSQVTIQKLAKAVTDSSNLFLASKTPESTQSNLPILFMLLRETDLSSLAARVIRKISSLPDYEERKLAAVMFTDIAGFSALTQADEKSALSLLETHNSIVRPIVSEYGGTEIKTIGDSFLLEFESALQATECAIALQKAFHKFDEQSTEKRGRILIRIGIHVGDVIHRNKDIFGDAVNIASRIEAVAPSGQICISEQVYAQVRNKIPLKFEKVGTETALKNISFPIDIYKIELQLDEKGDMVKSSHELDLRRIAVLPFANISPDPNDAYFADGLTEELISKLSLVKGLKVIARTSVMKYKGNDKSISEIGRELNSGTLVEGSVRKAGNRIRVTVQVINANNDEHLWASSYDNNLDDIFAVQAEIADKVSQSLPFSLNPSKTEASQMRFQDSKNVTAYTYFLKGMQLLNDRSIDSLRDSLELFSNATKIDPDFIRAHIAIGNCYAQLSIASHISREEGIFGMKSAYRRAQELDPNLAETHALASFIHWAEDNHSDAEKEARMALELNPNLAEVRFNLSRILYTLGYPRSAFKMLESAYSIDPLSGQLLRFLGLSLAWMGRDSEALELWDKNLKIAPYECHSAMALYFLGKKDYTSTEEEVSILERNFPQDYYTISYRLFLSANKRNKPEQDKDLEKLEKAFKGGGTYNRNLGYLKFFLGDLDGFFESMFEVVDEHTLDPFMLRYCPIFESARRDIRYPELLKKSGIDPDLKEEFP